MGHVIKNLNAVNNWQQYMVGSTLRGYDLKITYTSDEKK